MRRVVLLVAGANLACFGVEFGGARAIRSVSLFADNIDFLEDASVNFVIAVAISRTATNRARVGMALAVILLVPGLATLWTAWHKINLPVTPDAGLLALSGTGSLIVNLSGALLLARHRRHYGSLVRAAFLWAPNDAVANVAIIAAGIVTATLWQSAWPDLVVGLAIAAFNADAAREVWHAARAEHRAVP